MKCWKQEEIPLPGIWCGCMEMRQSIRIIEQLIDNIPEGDFQAKTKAVLKLPKGEFYTTGGNSPRRIGCVYCE